MTAPARSQKTARQALGLDALRLDEPNANAPSELEFGRLCDDAKESLANLLLAIQARCVPQVEKLAAAVPWTQIWRPLAELPQELWMRQALMASELKSFVVKLQNEARRDRPSDASRREQFDLRFESTLTAIERVFGAQKALRGAFLAGDVPDGALAYSPPPFLAFAVRALASERSARSDHVLGELLPFATAAGEPALLALAAALPLDAPSASHRDRALAGLAAPYEPPASSLTDDEDFARLAVETACLAGTLARLGFAHEDDLARRLSASFWGDNRWKPERQPEVSAALAETLHAMAPARPEWTEWLDAVRRATTRSALSGQSARWDRARLVFARISADLERQGLLAALPPSGGGEAPGSGREAPAAGDEPRLVPGPRRV
jgi:hypothetical protein